MTELWTLLPMEVPSFTTDAFNGTPLFPNTPGLSWFTNHHFQGIVGAILVLVFWVIAAKRVRVVPSKFGFLSEFIYDVVRNSIAREVLGHEFRKYLPFLLALFSFIVVNNLFGEFFLFMFPTFSEIGWAYALGFASFFLYNAAGIKKYGLSYFKRMTVPPGVPWWLLWLIIPLEIISNFITRPITLALRLWANLFAGHLVIMVFVVGGGWLLTQFHNPVWVGAGAVSLIASLAIFGLELLVAVLQAYVFTVLTAQYVSSAIAEEH